MKKLNILLMLMVLMFAACNNKHKKDEEEVIPTYFTMEGYYSSTSGEGFSKLDNGTVYFNRAADPLVGFVVQTANTETRTGTFPITNGSFRFILTKDEQYDSYPGTDLGTVTITKNTEHYMQGSFIFNYNSYNSTTSTWTTKPFKGTFSGKKN